MALFGKKKLSLEEILAGIAALSEEEKATLQAKIQGADAKSEQVEEKESDEQTTDGNGENESVETENVEENVETGENEVEENQPEEATTETEEVTAESETDTVTEPTEENIETETVEENSVVESPVDEQASENTGEIVKGLTDRVVALEETIKGLVELKAMMEEYTEKQKANFGYKGQIPGAKKDIHDMSADELKAHIQKGI